MRTFSDSDRPSSPADSASDSEFSIISALDDMTLSTSNGALSLSAFSDLSFGSGAGPASNTTPDAVTAAATPRHAPTYPPSETFAAADSTITLDSHTAADSIDDLDTLDSDTADDYEVILMPLSGASSLSFGSVPGSSLHSNHSNPPSVVQVASPCSVRSVSTSSSRSAASVPASVSNSPPASPSARVPPPSSTGATASGSARASITSSSPSNKSQSSHKSSSRSRRSRHSRRRADEADDSDSEPEAFHSAPGSHAGNDDDDDADEDASSSSGESQGTQRPSSHKRRGTHTRSVMSASEAQASIDDFFSDPGAFTSDKSNKLRLWQSLCIEFGLVELEGSVVPSLPDVPSSPPSEAWEDSSSRSTTPRPTLPPLPTSLTQARLLLKTHAHVNIAAYTSERLNPNRHATGADAWGKYADLLEPSAAALIRKIRKEHSFHPLGKTKRDWLEPLLKDFGFARRRYSYE